MSTDFTKQDLYYPVNKAGYFFIDKPDQNIYKKKASIVEHHPNFHAIILDRVLLFSVGGLIKLQEVIKDYINIEEIKKE